MRIDVVDLFIYLIKNVNIFFKIKLRCYNMRLENFDMYVKMVSWYKKLKMWQRTNIYSQKIQLVSIHSENNNDIS